MTEPIKQQHVVLRVIIVVAIAWYLSSAVFGTDGLWKSPSVPTPEPVKTIVSTEPSEYDSSLVRNYEIVETEDDPFGSAIRKQYRVLVPADISKEELKATLIQIVMDKTSENRDIDAISVFAYFYRTGSIKHAYPIGTVDWCPNGNWGDVNAKIASTNDRSSYEYEFLFIKDIVGNIEAADIPTDRDFEIDNYYQVVNDAEWDKSDVDVPDEDVVIQKVADKFGITKDEATDIITKVLLY